MLKHTFSSSRSTHFAQRVGHRRARNVLQFCSGQARDNGRPSPSLAVLRPTEEPGRGYVTSDNVRSRFVRSDIGRLPSALTLTAEDFVMARNVLSALRVLVIVASLSPSTWTTVTAELQADM